MAPNPTAESASSFDHRVLREALEAATTALAGVAERDPAPVEEARSALDAIERFHYVLVHHLRSEEEEGGWFAEIVYKAPHVAARLDMLRLEHEPFAARMAEIAEDARWAGVSRPAWRRVTDALHAFAQELGRHERAEEQLSADAILIDEGGGD